MYSEETKGSRHRAVWDSDARIDLGTTLVSGYLFGLATVAISTSTWDFWARTFLCFMYGVFAYSTCRLVWRRLTRGSR